MTCVHTHCVEYLQHVTGETDADGVAKCTFKDDGLGAGGSRFILVMQPVQSDTF